MPPERQRPGDLPHSEQLIDGRHLLAVSFWDFLGFGPRVSPVTFQK
jgi:hypothetical protein